MHPQVTAAEYTVPASAYADPYGAAAEVSKLFCAGVRSLLLRRCRGREIRTLNRIGVLPVGWDLSGRHCDH